MIYQHVTDPPSFVLKDGDLLENVTIRATGSETGRFLFKSSPMIVIEPKASVTIAGCIFVGAGSTQKVISVQ